jgi:short-subunit dehydrogenase
MTQQKYAVISGSSRGIGKEIAHTFYKNGFHIFMIARDIDKLLACKNEFEAEVGVKNSIYTIQADVSKKEAVLEAATNILKKTKQIDVLVNNAGTFIPGKISDEADNTFEILWETNVSSAYHLTRALLPQLQQAKAGHIFNICSTASIVPYINGGSYCISKFALLGFSKVLREEMKDKNIKVTAVLPGATLTDSWAGADIPANRFMQAVDVAEMLWSCYNTHPNVVIEELLLRPLAGDL